jgi:hypothetical protein
MRNRDDWKETEEEKISIYKGTYRGIYFSIRCSSHKDLVSGKVTDEFDYVAGLRGQGPCTSYTDGTMLIMECIDGSIKAEEAQGYVRNS